jgi:hypothetical protein
VCVFCARNRYPPQAKVQKLAKNEVLMINIGSLTTAGRVAAVKVGDADDCPPVTTIPLFAITPCLADSTAAADPLATVALRVWCPSCTCEDVLLSSSLCFYTFQIVPYMLVGASIKSKGSAKCKVQVYARLRSMVAVVVAASHELTI